jgi:N6-L-threonylcarbamoyladenine synthase
MKILSIETSCDETSIASIESLENSSTSYNVLAHETISQVNKHIEFGGVFPTLARREHEKNLVPILIRCLEQAKLLHLRTGAPYKGAGTSNSELPGDFYIQLLSRYPDLEKLFWEFVEKYDTEEIAKNIDVIAVTSGPGLPPALWVGVNFSKSLAKILGGNSELPIFPINHMEGHIVAALAHKVGNDIKIQEPKYPMLALLISGGHTELVLSTEPHKYQKIGETMDDAVGECFDKVARMLKLPYPGGPEIGKLAEIYRQHFQSTFPKLEAFPRPMLHSKNFNFSFSGLKTHILYLIQRLTPKDLDPNLPDENYLIHNPLGEKIKQAIAGEFEYAVRDVLYEKSKKAILETGAKSFVVGGGVISSSYLRNELMKLEETIGCKVYLSDKQMATDNALMIALVAATQIQNKKEPTSDFIAVGSKNYSW